MHSSRDTGTSNLQHSSTYNFSLAIFPEFGYNGICQIYEIRENADWGMLGEVVGMF